MEWEEIRIASKEYRDGGRGEEVRINEGETCTI